LDNLYLNIDVFSVHHLEILSFGYRVFIIVLLLLLLKSNTKYNIKIKEVTDRQTDRQTWKLLSRNT